MTSNQLTRRTLVGDLVTAVFCCEVAQKIANVARAPEPLAAARPVVPVVDMIRRSMNDITTYFYDFAERIMATIDGSGRITTYCYKAHERWLPSMERIDFLEATTSC